MKYLKSTLSPWHTNSKWCASLVSRNCEHIQISKIANLDRMIRILNFDALYQSQ